MSAQGDLFGGPTRFDTFQQSLPQRPENPSTPEMLVQNYEVHLLNADGREFTVVVQATGIQSDPHFVRFVNHNAGNSRYPVGGVTVALIPSPRFRYCRTL